MEQVITFRTRNGNLISSAKHEIISIHEAYKDNVLNLQETHKLKFAEWN